LCLIGSVVAQFGNCGNFDYSNQANWDSINCGVTGNDCGLLGVVESPVRINDSEVATDQVSQLRWVGYDDTANTYYNDGDDIHYFYASTTAGLRPLWAIDEVPYKPFLISAHLPPEHFLPSHVNISTRPELELQFYHTTINGTYVVVSFFFYATTFDNPFLDFLNPSLIGGGNSVDNITISGLADFLEAIQEDFQDSYYYYQGSLTVPPCTQGVEWYLMDVIFEAGRNQLNALQSSLSRSYLSGGNARDSQAIYNEALYFDSPVAHISDPVCSVGVVDWDEHPDECTMQLDSTTCYYCSGRAVDKETDFKNRCLYRNGKACEALYNTPEADTYCNLAFECPASTISSSFFLLVSLAFLFVLKNFW
jgi:carbonic anhydrase